MSVVPTVAVCRSGNYPTTANGLLYVVRSVRGPKFGLKFVGALLLRIFFTALGWIFFAGMPGFALEQLERALGVAPGDAPSSVFRWFGNGLWLGLLVGATVLITGIVMGRRSARAKRASAS